MIRSSMKRFYKEAGIGAVAGAWAVFLDGKAMMSPAKAPMHLPTEALALAIADEWNAQKETIKPSTMPLMQFAATAIDRTQSNREEVLRVAATYAASDLVCYRAAFPEDLVAEQRRHWDPLLQSLRDRYDVVLAATTGVAFVQQSPIELRKIEAILAAMGDFTLTVATSLIEELGSLIIALALIDGEITSDQAMEAAFVDEIYQANRWGWDGEVERRHKAICQSLDASCRFLSLLGSRSL